MSSAGGSVVSRDVIETRGADQRRRRWPWVVATVAIVAALIGTALTPVAHRRWAANGVSRIAAVSSDRVGLEQALDHAVDALEQHALPTDQDAIDMAARALNGELADRLQALEGRLPRTLFLAPSVRDLRSKAAAALSAEITERRLRAADKVPVQADLTTETQQAQKRFADALDDAADRWDLRLPTPPTESLHAGDAVLARLSLFLDDPLPYRLLVGSISTRLLDLSGTNQPDVPKYLADTTSDVLVTPDNTVLVRQWAEWILRSDGRRTPFPHGNRFEGLLPATDHAVWAIRYLEAGTSVRSVSLDTSRTGPSFLIPTGAVAGGLRAGVVVADLSGAGLEPGMDGDFASSRLAFVRPDGTDELIAPGCNVVLSARGDAVLWMPCPGSGRAPLAHLTNVRTGKSSVVRSSTAHPEPYGGNDQSSAPDGKWMVTTWETPGKGHALGIVDVQRGEVQLLAPRTGSLGGTAWSPDSRYLFYETKDGGISVWDTRTQTTKAVRYRNASDSTVLAALPSG